MNKFLKALSVLAATVAISSPASAQLSGFLSLDTFFPGPAFSARLGLNYGLNLNNTTKATLGFRYNFNFNTPSNTNAFAIVSSSLNENLTIGGALILGLSDIGATNQFALILRPYATLLLTRTDSLALAATVTLNTSILPTFGFQPWLALDGAFTSGSLGIAFGLRTILTIIPNFAFALTTYLHTNYNLSNDLKLFGGTALLFNNGLEWSGALYQGDLDYKGIYAGLQYTLSDSFALRFTTGYVGNVFFTLTGILR
jgi:hypothetical protein